MSFVKPLNLLYFTLHTGFDVQKPGLVLTLLNDGTVRAVDVNGADDAKVGMGDTDGPEPTFAVAYMTSEDPLYDPHSTNHSVQYLTGVEMAVVREGVVMVPYHLDLAFGAIAIGDLVSTLNQNILFDGHVRNHVPTALPNAYADGTTDTILEEANAIVGIALEAKAANTTGYIKILLQIREIQYEHT